MQQPVASAIRLVGRELWREVLGPKLRRSAAWPIDSASALADRMRTDGIRVPVCIM